jgi:hypothetical protein
MHLAGGGETHKDFLRQDATCQPHIGEARQVVVGVVAVYIGQDLDDQLCHSLVHGLARSKSPYLAG